MLDKAVNIGHNEKLFATETVFASPANDTTIASRNGPLRGPWRRDFENRGPDLGEDDSSHAIPAPRWSATKNSSLRAA
jgi:hypothetical protein